MIMASLSSQPSKTVIRSAAGSNGSHGNRNSSRPTVKFARRTSSGRYVNLSRDELDMSGEISGDLTNYTVHMPPTPDNQPMDLSVAAVKAEEQYVSNSLFTACSMPACDGKIMKDERGADVLPCDCRYVKFFVKYMESHILSIRTTTTNKVIIEMCCPGSKFAEIATWMPKKKPVDVQVARSHIKSGIMRMMHPIFQAGYSHLQPQMALKGMPVICR
jgi:hypothetical protein